MAYDVTEERLKVKGSEQITRDLKVNRDTFINGKAETGSIDNKGDLKVAGEILAGDDVTISGDLYVNGTEYINDSETAQTTDNYLVLRHNQTTPLGTDEYSGVAVHNYASGKTATITTDKDGTWRVADNTETDTNYTNISYYNGTYYTGLTRTAATVISGMKTAFDEDELDESVYYNNSYYHYDGNNWFPVSLVDNKLTLGSAVTDSTTITALNALTKADLVYFRTLTITVINPVENQPLLTRAEASDLTGGQALTWDATNEKAVGKTIDTTVTASSSNLITSGAVKTAVDNEATARDTAITNAVNALDVTDTAVSGKYVSAVSETNGKISVTRADLPNRVNNAYSINGSYACNTAAGTAAKTVALPGFILTKGSKFIINVTNANTAASALTLNVNDTGAKPIRVDGNVTSSTSYSLPAGLYNCYYDGTYWNIDSSYETLNARNANWANMADYTRGTAYCYTAAGTAAKTAYMRGFTLVTGATFPITFGVSNTAASALTLNVNGTGAKSIYLGGSASSSSNYALPAGTYLCTYDGSNFYIDKTYAAPGARFALSAERASNAYSINGQVSCDTAAATAAKTVSLAGFNLIKGSKLIVKVSYTNTAASALTLNVNNTGAKTIRVNGTVTSATSHALATGVYNCYYDGTYWNMDNSYEAYSARSASFASSADYTRGNAYCTTAAATAAKEASMRGFVLATGATFPITFTNSNTAASALTLAVNGTTAKPIYINNAASSSTNHTLPAGTYLCRYGGTNYYIDTDYAVTTARNANYAGWADYTRGTAHCSTAAGTAAKTANMAGYVLQSGTTFPISFSNSNTAASALTLNINSKGAKPIYINGAASSSSNYTLPAGTYLCTYDGTNYLIDTAGSNVSTKMNMANPTGTGSFSLNRKAGTTVGSYSFAEGLSNTASGDYSHAEGWRTTASSASSHAEGLGTTASGEYSHAEGNYTTASGYASHAEGFYPLASGDYSHAEGVDTTASGYGSHVEGNSTTASGEYQHVQGKYNVASTTWAFVIGGGTSSARKNILAFDWNGNLHIFGDIYVHCNADGTGGTKK